jgi:hypothetical protein
MFFLQSRYFRQVLKTEVVPSERLHKADKLSAKCRQRFWSVCMSPIHRDEAAFFLPAHAFHLTPYDRSEQLRLAVGARL